jgi:hypothetical protein
MSLLILPSNRTTVDDALEALQGTRMQSLPDPFRLAA